MFKCFCVRLDGEVRVHSIVDDKQILTDRESQFLL